MLCYLTSNSSSNVPKLNKNKVNLTMPPKRNKNVDKLIGEPVSGTMSLTPEVEQQFESELCWCIQQLQIALKSGKLNNKQVQDHTKALNTLMSNSASLIKKRQTMRLSFGDYRAKMAAEEKKSSKNAINMKVKPAIPSNKSVFVKKSSGKKSDPSSNGELSNGIQNIKIDFSKSSSQNQKDFTYEPSNNSFRFSFDVSKDL